MIAVVAGFFTLALIVLAVALQKQEKAAAEREKAWDLERGALLSNATSEREALASSLVEERQAWAEERAELLTRIQHPQIVMRHMEGTEPVVMRDEEDEIDLVGVISAGEPDGD